jgi:hypothetical protein
MKTGVGNFSLKKKRRKKESREKWKELLQRMHGTHIPTQADL